MSLGWDSEDAVITCWSGQRLSGVSAESEKTPPIIAVCERESKTELVKEQEEGKKRQRRWSRNKSSSQTSQIFACLCEICPITAAVCSVARCVSSCLSSSVTVVIWGLNQHFMFNYVLAEIFLWWGCHFQDVGWHFVWPSLVFLSDVYVIFLSDPLSNLFSPLLFSECMSEAISVVWNGLWKLAFKTELKHSDFYQLILVCIEIFSNYLTCKILFIDTQHMVKIKLLKYFILDSKCSVWEVNVLFR